MDFLIEILSLGTYSVFGLILLFVCIYYMLIDDEEEESEQNQDNANDVEEIKSSLLTEIKNLKLEEELGLLSEKKKARLDEIVKKYKQLSD